MAEHHVTPDDQRTMARTALVLFVFAGLMTIVVSVAVGVVLWRLVVRLLR